MTEVFPPSSSEAGHFSPQYGPEVWLTAQAVRLSYISPVPQSEVMFGTETDAQDIQTLVANHMSDYIERGTDGQQFDTLPGVRMGSHIVLDSQGYPTGLDIAIASITYKTDVVYKYFINTRGNIVYSAVQHTPHEAPSRLGGDGRFRDISQAGVQQWRAAAVLRLSWELHERQVRDRQRLTERVIRLSTRSA